MNSIVGFSAKLIFGLLFSSYSWSAPLEKLALPSNLPSPETVDRLANNTLFQIQAQESDWYSKFEISMEHSGGVHHLIFRSFENQCKAIQKKQILPDLDGLFEVGRTTLEVQQESPERQVFELRHHVCEDPEPVVTEGWFVRGRPGTDLGPVPWQTYLTQQNTRPLKIQANESFRRIQLILGGGSDPYLLLSLSATGTVARTGTEPKIEKTLKLFQKTVLGQLHDPNKNILRTQFFSPSFSSLTTPSSLCKEATVSVRPTPRGRELAIDNLNFQRGLDIRQFDQCFDDEVGALSRKASETLSGYLESRYPKFEAPAIDLGNQELIEEFQNLLSLLERGELVGLENRLGELLLLVEKGEIKDLREDP